MSNNIFYVLIFIFLFFMVLFCTSDMYKVKGTVKKEQHSRGVAHWYRDKEIKFHQSQREGKPETSGTSLSIHHVNFFNLSKVMFSLNTKLFTELADQLDPPYHAWQIKFSRNAQSWLCWHFRLTLDLKINWI